VPPHLPEANPPSANAFRATPTVTSAQFRATLSRMPSAVSIIATRGPAGIGGLTCSAVCAVSDEPPTVLACVHNRSAANAIIRANGVLCVNCLSSEQQELSQAFAGIGRLSIEQRFACAEWGTLVTGAPYCKGSLLALDCEVIDTRDVGTHSIFIGRVVATAEATGEPLVYQRRAYATTRPL
jgi:flavin reductase (DIM6/NTAB) family NADH-FMN oxidoreductase RutF